MIDACVMTMVRDGDDYLYPCIAAVAPHVKRVKIAVDGRSKDNTRMIAIQLAADFPNVSVWQAPVRDPLIDLVAIRNSMLSFTEKWGWIVDSDELHYIIPNLGEADAYSFMCFAPWNTTHGHKASQRAIIGRIFRNKPGLEWRGKFGKEKLYCGDKRVFDESVLLPYRYIHFTHLKKDKWREEMNQRRVADGRSLSPLPEDVIKVIEHVHENMPNVRG